MDTKWTAVHTYIGCEQRLATLLTKRGIENYCPLNMVEKSGRNFRKVVSEPLFKKTVFVRLDEKQYSKLAGFPGVINLVYYHNKPVVIESKEIKAIRDFLDEYKYIQLEKANVSRNESVRVISSPIKNYLEGVLAVKDNHVKVLLPSLGYILVAEIGRSSMRLLNWYKDYFPELHLQ